MLLVASVVAASRAQRLLLLRKAEMEQARLRAESAEFQARALESENRQQELELDRVRRIEELDRLKSHFFANTSHEFRTPLTLILGPIQDALDGRFGPLTSRLERQFALMYHNGRRLLQLINELLDLARLEAGELHLHVRQKDLVAFLRPLVRSFTARAERDEITLQFHAEPPSIPLYFDSEKLETVVINLIGNAFKFTPERGKIRVSVTTVQEAGCGFAEIVVKDTGQGIPTEELPYIFDRFRQVERSQVRSHEGSGIGLALAKELVDLHGGTIAVVSELGFGTRFTVRLPEGTEHFAPGDLVEDGDSAAWISAYEDRKHRQLPMLAAETEEAETKARPVVLIVEDYPDMRFYLRDHLAAHYDVVEAADGADGLAQARQRHPDLVISDIMMPELDGIALCRALKADAKLNDIPVILLTARAGDASQLEGLDTGAEAYLTKPFSAEELLVRVEQLITTRQKLRQRFSAEVRIGPTEVVATSEEAVFVDRVRAIIEAHLDEPDFSVERLAEEVGTGTRQLSRKLRQLTTMTPSVYIRQLRLERAAQLLEQRAGTVSEIAYRVGFNRAEYFSKQFRKVFGVSPSDYRAQAGGRAEEEKDDLA
ncbi:MAG: ATP-binding protein [Rhodothermales bacterium]